MGSEKLLTIREAAESLGVCTKTIHRMLSAGLLPGSYLAGARRGAWRIPASDVASYRESRGIARNGSHQPTGKGNHTGHSYRSGTDR
jgi:excisionase family DNA binding protein